MPGLTGPASDWLLFYIVDVTHSVWKSIKIITTSQLPDNCKIQRSHSAHAQRPGRLPQQVFRSKTKYKGCFRNLKFCFFNIVGEERETGEEEREWAEHGWWGDPRVPQSVCARVTGVRESVLLRVLGIRLTSGWHNKPLDPLAHLTSPHLECMCFLLYH